MRVPNLLAAILACLGMFILSQWAIIALLRAWQIRLPFALAFHFHRRRVQDLLLLRLRFTRSMYVFISGILLFALPLIAGITVLDLVAREPNEKFGLPYLTGSIFFYILAIVVGISTSEQEWREKADVEQMCVDKRSGNGGTSLGA